MRMRIIFVISTVSVAAGLIVFVASARPKRGSSALRTGGPVQVLPSPTPAACKHKSLVKVDQLDGVPADGAFDPASPNYNMTVCNFRWSACCGYATPCSFIKTKLVKNAPGACESFFESERTALPKDEVCCDCYPNCEKKATCGGNVTVKISRPLHSSPSSSESFLAQRSFSDVPSGDTITAQAVVTPSGNTSALEWYVTAGTGTIKDENPSDKKGATFTFVPNPGPHPPYKPANGDKNRSAALAYTIRADFCDTFDSVTLMQDERDVIRQEYVNHGLTVPARSELNIAVPTAHYTKAELNNTAYDFILGNPGKLAEDVRAAYNTLIKDDVQAVPLGTTGLSPMAVVVKPGATIDTVGPILDTPVCNGAPKPLNCDDQKVGNTIVAGPNGIAETVAVNQTTDFGITMSSGWRNPEHNEAVGGVLTSRHQFGNAIDLVVGNVPGKTVAQLNCILQTAAKRVTTAFAEHNATIRPCNVADVDHVHVQQ